MIADATGKRLGNYKIVGRLGEGGVATVYRAEQLNVKREVALKILTVPGDDREYLHRLEREAQTIARLSHPYILKLFDFGHENGVTYLVTELMTGGSLADLIHKGPLSLDDTARILEQLASALDYAHQQGVIHRDLKPHNILLDRDGNVLLADFGLARLLQQATTALTQSGSVVGTPAYMAPEQWSGDSTDARTDIYALGVVVFEMLTGKLPFNSETPYSMMNLHIYESPPHVYALDGRLSRSVDSVLLKALDKDPAQRFASAGAMADAFRAAIRPMLSVLATQNQETMRVPNPAERDARPSTPRAASLLRAVFVFGALILAMILALSYMVDHNVNAQAPDGMTIPAQSLASALVVSSETPDIQQTLIAVVGATDTANAIPFPSSTSTFTDTPLPKITPTTIFTLSPVRVIARARADFAPVRTGPSMNNAIIRNLAQGDSLTVRAQAAVRGERWYQVILPNGAEATGWVLATEVDIQPPGTFIPTAVSIPPSPVPATWTPAVMVTAMPTASKPGGSTGGGGSGTGSNSGGCVPIPLLHIGC
ncbi:MAG TPA: protein kinase [Aggregatilineales bacterium]|nr:protein kinase [Aggregatilineales bacterium]